VQVAAADPFVVGLVAQVVGGAALQDGAVELWGIVDSASEKKAVRVAAEVTPGVRAVNDNLIIRPAESGS